MTPQSADPMSQDHFIDARAVCDERDRLRTELSDLRLRVRNARLEWAMVCPCGCQACDDFYEKLKLTDDVGDKP